MQFDNPTTVALAKVVKAAILKEARNRLRPGEYGIDATIQVKGMLKVGEDEEYTPTAKLPVIGVLALMSRYCGVTREAAIKALEKIASDALNDFENVGKACNEAGDWMTDMSKMVCDMTEKLPKATRAGKVRTDLTTMLVA